MNIRNRQFIGIILCAALVSVGTADHMRLCHPQIRYHYVNQLMQQSRAKKLRAEQWALSRGLRCTTQVDGVCYELVDMVGERPLYFATCNADAAISTATDLVQSQLSFNLDGEGMTIGLWDQNMPLETHREFQHPPHRILLIDGGPVSDHSTLVAGTLAATGINPEAMGMAPSAEIEAYDWTDDLSEMAQRAAAEANEVDKLMVSNHSYGFSTGWAYTDLSGKTGWHWMAEWEGQDSVEPMFGQYSDRAAALDELAYRAPYFLMFVAAGNDRSDNPRNGETIYYYTSRFRPGIEWESKAYDSDSPPGDGEVKGGFDTIHTMAVAKNIVTVGAVTDAVLNDMRDLDRADITGYTAFGPADDGRIKPDVVADGQRLYSTASDNDSAYDYASGTSLACPNVSGSAALLIQYYDRLFPGQRLRAASLKGLILHTADDLGTPGPDYRFGWGLVNIEAAVELIMRHATVARGGHLIEGVLTETDVVHRYMVDVNDTGTQGTDTLKVTLCWTDPHGRPTEALDDSTPALVHDLDLRIIDPNKGVWYPFILDPLAPDKPARIGDNHLDPVEQIVLEPLQTGTYVIQVGIKNELQTPDQAYSLISSMPLERAYEVTVQ